MRRRKATAVRGGSSQDGRRDDLLGRRIGTEATSSSHVLQTVFDGRELIGFLLSRGKLGVEAFDSDERSLGVFPTVKAAVAAIPGAAASMAEVGLLQANQVVESLCSAPRYADLFSRYQHNDKLDCHGDEAPSAADVGDLDIPACLRRAAP